MKIYSLKCRECGQPFDGLPGDVVFACTSCRKAFVFSFWYRQLDRETSDQDLQSPVVRLLGEFQGQAAYTVRLLSPAAGFNADGFLPFWQFTMRPSFQVDDERKRGRYATLEGALYPMVPAFNVHGLLYIGWPGQDLDLKQELALSDEPVTLAGIARDPYTSFVIAWYLVYRRADQLADISNVTMEVEHLSTELVAVPVKKEGNSLRFSFSEKTYPAHFFDDLSAILNL